MGLKDHLPKNKSLKASSRLSLLKFLPVVASGWFASSLVFIFQTDDSLKANQWALISLPLLALLLLFLFTLYKIRKEQKSISNTADSLSKIISLLKQNQLPKPEEHLPPELNQLLLAIETYSQQQTSSQTPVEKIIRQINHDIRSPLSAIEVCLKSSDQIPKPQAELLRMAVDRIRSIPAELKKTFMDQDQANGSSYQLKDNQKESTQLATTFIENAVKHALARNKNLRISLDIYQLDSLFFKLNSQNWCDAVEGLIKVIAQGTTPLSLKLVVAPKQGEDAPVRLIFKGQGKDEERSLTEALGSRQNPSVHFKDIQSRFNELGIKIDFFSTDPKIGTDSMILLEIPKAPIPTWYLKSLSIGSAKKIIIIDDDPTIALAWGTMLSGDYDVTAISSRDEIKAFYSDLKNNSSAVDSEALYLIDYNLGIPEFTGVDVACETKKVARSVMVSNSHEEVVEAITTFAQGLEFFPKQYMSRLTH